MPTYKNTKKTYRRRRKYNYKPKKSIPYKNNGVGTPYRPLKTFLSNYRFVRLHYSEEVSISSMSGSAGTSKYYTNSLYDPFAGLGGHQPQFYDQLSVLYNNSTVYKAFFIIRPIHFVDSGSNKLDFLYTVLPTGTNSISTGWTMDSVGEKVGARNFRCNTGGSMPTCKVLVDNAKMTGHTLNNYIANFPIYGEIVATSTPTTPMYLNIFSAPSDGTSSGTAYFKVDLYLYAKFFNPKQVASS